MNLACMISRAGEQYGYRHAFLWGDECISYAQAHAASSSLAAGLRELGVRPGDRCGVFMRNCPRLLESFFAIWKAGACVVPINARFVGDEVAHLLRDSEARLVLFSQEFREMMAGLRAQLPCVEHFVCDGEPAPGQYACEQIVAAHTGLDVLEQRSETDVAWLFYTSGTTGLPKGAMLTHGNLIFVALGMVADLVHFEAEDVGLHAAPLTHATGFLALSMTMKGVAQAILKPDRFDPEVFCATVASRRVTATRLVPTQIKMLLRYRD
jgi:acyl-CoA synthetase (AMP-forming)/AMP-acid ligase II